MKRISDMTDNEYAQYEAQEELYNMMADESEYMTEHEDDFGVFNVPGSEF